MDWQEKKMFELTSLFLNKNCIFELVAEFKLKPKKIKPKNSQKNVESRWQNLKLREAAGL